MEIHRDQVEILKPLLHYLSTTRQFMKIRAIVSYHLILPLFVFLWTCFVSTPCKADTSAAWREVWENVHDHYSYLFLKQLSWDQIWEESKNEFTTISDPDEFADKAYSILSRLDDWHIFIRTPSNKLYGLQKDITPNYHPDVLRPKYAKHGGYQSLVEGQAIIHGWVTPKIAHIIITTLGDNYSQFVADEDLQRLLQLYSQADGWILDLRLNAGGDETLARQFISNFIENEFTYAWSRVRLDKSNPEQLSDFQPRKVMPFDARPKYKGKIVGLIGERTMSSAESFALMIRSIPGGVLVGDRSRGASGNPQVYELDNLGIQYFLPSWVAYDAKKELFEDVGITPEIFLDPELSFDETSDFVLEKGIQIIEADQNQFGVPGEWIVKNNLTIQQLLTDGDLDGVSNLHEFIQGTNPHSNASLFKINFENDPGFKIYWKGIPGRTYHLLGQSDIGLKSPQVIQTWKVQESEKNIVWEASSNDLKLQTQIFNISVILSTQ